jgi:hypothetical protein
MKTPEPIAIPAFAGFVFNINSKVSLIKFAINTKFFSGKQKLYVGYQDTILPVAESVQFTNL